MQETMDKGDVCQDVSKIALPTNQGEASSQERSTRLGQKDTPTGEKKKEINDKRDVSKSSTRWSKESRPVSSGIANAKKKLRAFAIQKKLSQNPLCSSTPLLMNTPSKTTEKTAKAVPVLIKSSGSLKTKPSTPTSVTSKTPGAVLKKPPLPKSDPDGRRRNAIRDMEETKKREFQMERMLELNIPLWLIPPDTLPELKCAHAMPTASMPPLKKLLSLEQMEEMFQRAEEYERKGIKIKFTLDRDTFKDPDKEIKMIAIRQDDSTPIEVEKKDEKEEPKQQEQKEESSRPSSQHRSSHSRLSSGSRRHSGRDDRGHRHKDSRHRLSEPSKHRPIKHSTTKPDQPTETVSPDLDDFVICDSWSPDNDSKDTTKPKKPSREIQKVRPSKPTPKITKSSQPKPPSPIILEKNLKALTMVAEYSSDSLDDFPDDDATVIGSPSLSERNLSEFKRSIYSPDPLSPSSDTRLEPKIAPTVEPMKPVIVKSSNLTPPTESLLYLIEMGQPDVFTHSKSQCVKETKCQPSIMFAVSPRICKCIPKRKLFFKELAEKKNGLLKGLHAMESSSEVQSKPIRDWYPTEQYSLTGRSTIELSTNWETDDSNPDQPKAKTKTVSTAKAAPTLTPALRKGNLIDYTNYTIQAPLATSPRKKKDGALDEEYEKFMQAVWSTDKTEEADFEDDSVISSKGATTDRAYCSGSEMTKSLNDSSTKTSLYSEVDFKEDSSEIEKIATPQKCRTEDIANKDSVVPAKKPSSEYWSEDSAALPKEPIAVQSSSPKKKISPLKKKPLPKKKATPKKKKNEKPSKKSGSKSSGSSESESSDSDSNSHSSSSSSSSESGSNETGKKKTTKKVMKQSKKKVSKLKRLNKKKRLKRLKDKRLQKRLKLKKSQEEETLKKGKDGDKSKKKVVARKEDQPKKKPSPTTEKEKEKKKKRRKSSTSSSSSSSSSTSSSESSDSSSSSDVVIPTKETGKKSGASGRSKELFSMETLRNIKRERTSEDEMQVTDFIPRRGRASIAQEIISVNQLHSDFVEKTQLIATIKQEPITSDWESPTATQRPKLSATEPAKSPIRKPQAEIEKQQPEIEQHVPELEKQLPEIVKPSPRIESPLPGIENPLPEIEIPLPTTEKPLAEIEEQSPKTVQSALENKQPSAHTTVVDESIWNEFELMQNTSTLDITQTEDSSSDSSSDEDSSSSDDSSDTSSVAKRSPESSHAAPRLYSIDDEQEEVAQAESFSETVTDNTSMNENIEYEEYAAEDMAAPIEEPMVQHAIETVISSSGRGEIKCDWRPSEQHSNTVEKPKKPSRWGKKQEDAAKEKSNRYSDKDRRDTERNNVYRIKSILDPESPEEFQQSTSLVHPTEMNEVFKIETISSVHKKFSGNSPANSSYDRAYADMFGESDNLTYGNCFEDQSVQYQDVKFSPKPISLDERISLALQYLGGGDEAQQKSKPSSVKPEPVPLEDAPEKGILILSGVPKPSRADPRITKPLKRVCFADGFLPGQDSDTEEPPIKKAKTVEKPVIKYGCAWPCPSWHEDYDPEWDELPPPPPPPGSPPPPEIPLMPLHLLRPPPLLNSMHLLPPLPHTADKKDDKSSIQTMPTVTRLPKVLSHPDTSK